MTLGLTGCVSGLQGALTRDRKRDKFKKSNLGRSYTNPVIIEGSESEAGQLPGAIIGGVAGSSVDKEKVRKSSQF